MTPEEMTRAVLLRIETARAVLEDGATGYVLHTRDYAHFICQQGKAARLGSPLDDDLVVLTTYARAVVLQRYWNSVRGDGDTLNKVLISLRREAINEYIYLQQRIIDVLTKGATRENI